MREIRPLIETNNSDLYCGCLWKLTLDDSLSTLRRKKNTPQILSQLFIDERPSRRNGPYWDNAWQSQNCKINAILKRRIGCCWHLADKQGAGQENLDRISEYYPCSGASGSFLQRLLQECLSSLSLWNPREHTQHSLLFHVSMKDLTWWQECIG